MQFKDIIGQQTVKEQLVQMVQQNRLSHALLFLGKEGSGALPLAIAFAQYILCEKIQGKQSDLNNSMFENIQVNNDDIKITLKDSCGKCPSCLKSGKLAHPDIHFSYPTIKKDKDHKPVSTDYISQWREFICEFPYSNDKDWIDFLKFHPSAKIDSPANKQGNITTFESADIIHKLALKSFESGYKILIMWMPEYLGDQGNKLLKLIEEPPPNTLFI